MAVNWRVGTYGMDLLVPTTYDLTDSTALTLYIKKQSNGSVLTKTDPDVTNNGDDSAGVLKYTIADGDLDVTGTYWVVPEVTKTGKVLQGYPAVSFEVVGQFEEGTG